MKTLLTLLTLFSLLLLTGCTTKEVEILQTPCAKPTIDMADYPEPKSVQVNVHKGTIVVTIKNDEYNKIKNTNQDIKDRYVKLLAWLLVNIEKGLIKKE